jgi:hypothetical protein
MESRSQTRIKTWSIVGFACGFFTFLLNEIFSTQGVSGIPLPIVFISSFFGGILFLLLPAALAFIFGLLYKKTFSIRVYENTLILEIIIAALSTLVQLSKLYSGS